MKKLITPFFSILILLVIGLSSCQYFEEPATHEETLVDANHTGNSGIYFHGDGLNTPLESCARCHGNDLNGSPSTPSCRQCHLNLWDFGDITHDIDVSGDLHALGYETPFENGCGTCHGEDMKGGEIAQSCFNCHLNKWDFGEATHTYDISGDFHAEGYQDPINQKCGDCHGADLTGSGIARSCYDCHLGLWNFYLTPHEDLLGEVPHAAGYGTPVTSNCTECHGSDLKGSDKESSCWTCHLNKWDFGNTPHQDSLGGSTHAAGYTTPVESNCGECHGSDLKGSETARSCWDCHLNYWDFGDTAHSDKLGSSPHAVGYGTPVASGCGACHGTDLKGSDTARSCLACHLNKWDYSNTEHKDIINLVPHAAGYGDPDNNGCSNCHGVKYSDGTFIARNCSECHGTLWEMPADHNKEEHGYMHPSNSEDVNQVAVCGQCHGTALEGGVARTCYASGCHTAGGNFDDDDGGGDDHGDDNDKIWYNLQMTDWKQSRVNSKQ